jgi:hypothetical protein
VRSERGWKAVSEAGPLGPITSKRRAELAARALADFAGERPADALPQLRARVRRLAHDLRFEDAARLRDRVTALEEVVDHLGHLERLRESRVCVLAPAREPGFRRAFFVAGGRVAAVRSVPPGSGGRLELAAGMAEAARIEPSFAPEDAGELLVVAGFLRRPGPELRIVPLDSPEFLAA